MKIREMEQGDRLESGRSEDRSMIKLYRGLREEKKERKKRRKERKETEKTVVLQ